SSPGAQIEERPYWEMDFPDEGEEHDGDPRKLVDEFEDVLMGAIKKRLRADVPVGAYLSGGLDSSMIVAMSAKIKGQDLSTYTVRVKDPKLDELAFATLVAKHAGVPAPIVQQFGDEETLGTYPQLIHAAECPVIDTACAALLQLAGRVHASNQK